jgi:hypothetical protein
METRKTPMSSTEGEDITKERLLDKADMKEPSEFSDWTSKLRQRK